jgi:hypothetical protein
MKLSLVIITTPALFLASAGAFKAHHIVPKPTQWVSQTTSVHAAISPMNEEPRSMGNSKIPSVAELKKKSGEVVLEPYYGISNGILGAVPAILLLHGGRYS